MLMGPPREEQNDSLLFNEPSRGRPGDRDRDRNRPGPGFRESGPQQGMTRLMLNVGRNQQVEVRDVVGAIAGETGLSGRQIGKIVMQDSRCFVEVPTEFARDVVRVMDGNQIRGLRIEVKEVSDGGRADDDQRSMRKRPATVRPFRAKRPNSQNWDR
jgi:ATP-dependent RNA helicase DeaD